MKKILLVEDEAIIALSEAGIIQRHGYKIITAYNGEAAVDSVRSDPEISLVLMDIDLGTGIDGNETARRILKQRELPIVFLTSHAEKHMVDKVKDITRYGYILKNAGEFVLMESIAMAYELYQAHREIAKENEERKKTEKLLRERNSFIETVIGNLSIGISVNYLDIGDNLYRNRSFEEICGLPMDEPIDTETFFDKVFPDPEYRESVKKRIFEDIASRDPERMQWDNLKVTHADGSERIVSAGMIPLYDQNLMISTIQDTTLHREAEKRLLESEKKYADLFEYSPIVLWEEDFSRVAHYLEALKRDGVEDLASYIEKHPDLVDTCVPLIQVTDINRATMKLLDTDTKDIALGSLKKTFTPTSSDMLKRELVAIWEGKTLVEDTGSILPPVGQREVIIRWQALPEHSEPYTRVIVSFLDITDLKKNEEELRTKELQSKQLFEQSGMGIILSDETNAVIDANPYACECLGYSIEEMRGLKAVDLIHPDDLLLISPEENLTKVRSGNPVELERRFRTRNGSYIYVLVIMRKLTGFDERVSHVVMFRDITQRKVAEKRVVDLLKEKELLLKEVHHRIKNDMTTISSILSLQSSTIHSEEAKTALAEAEQRISLMQRIYDLLYTGENIRSLEISIYLTSIVDAIREYTMDSGRISIETDFEAIEVPMKQAFPIGIIVNELITNARKYAFPGRDDGTIHTSVLRGANDYIEIRVSDDGIGFPEQYASEENDSGFGMTLVRAYAAQYEGKVQIESNKGEGATIKVTLKKGRLPEQL